MRRVRDVSRVFGAVLVLLLVVAGVGLIQAADNDPGFPSGGTIYAQGYNRDRQTQAFRTGLNVADSNSVSVVLGVAGNRFRLNGRQTIYVSCRFATSSTNTCKVRVVWVYSPDGGTTLNVLGTSTEQQANASVLQDQGTSNFMAPDIFFDGHGATDAWIMLTSAPSGGGTVDFWIGSA